MPDFSFHQIDVFASKPLSGNPLAVVIGADDLSDAQMAAFANWTNLSETTFLLRPTTPDADYRVRIFTPHEELPFAGHPTLGSAHAWLAEGGVPRDGFIVQECAAGLIPIRHDAATQQLAFSAPPRRRTGVVGDDTLTQALGALGLDAQDITGAQWADNGPGWMVLALRTRAAILGVKPDFAAMGDLRIGLVAPWDKAVDGNDADFEVRGFVGGAGGYEDPVTGSLNASLAQWLIESGQAPDQYVARQGTVLGRRGRVSIHRIDDAIWVGGESVTHIRGSVTL